MRGMAIRISGVAALVLATMSMALPHASFATVQDGLCWQPDVEFPIPCDDVDDD